MPLQPGQVLYRVQWEGGRPKICRANFVHYRGPGWYRWRNLITGVEWNERGLQWSPSREHAATIAVVGLLLSPLEQRRQDVSVDMMRVLCRLLDRLVVADAAQGGQ